MPSGFRPTIRRRSLVALAASVPTLTANSAIKSTPPIWDLASWSRDPELYFQKGLKGDRSHGRLISPVPVDQISSLLGNGGDAAYWRVEEIFDGLSSRVWDPCGALLAVPDYALVSLEDFKPPPYSSERLAAELLELYWAAALRDVPFAEYSNFPGARIAAAELFKLGIAGSADPEQLFTPAHWHDGSGFSSYFLNSRSKEWPFYREPTFRSLPNGTDFLTDHRSWSLAQSGEVSIGRENILSKSADYLRDGRGLATLVYRDYPAQFFNSAALQLNEFSSRVWELARPFRFQDRNIPFLFGGIQHALLLISECVDIALRVCWRLKWGAYFFPRPEELAHWAVNHRHERLKVARKFVSESSVSSFLHSSIDFLPQAYPDGCPAHPSFPGGHGVAAGAAITALKFFVRLDARLPSGEMPEHLRHLGSPSVSRELDKLAWAVTFGRSFAGIHYRSDGMLGIKLGEKIAISHMRAKKRDEPIGYRKQIRAFGGETIEI